MRLTLVREATYKTLHLDEKPTFLKLTLNFALDCHVITLDDFR